MCGIVAYRGADASHQVSVVGALAERLHHRGPDDHGVYGSQPSALAHTRLSIIDVAGGHQPIVSADGRLALVANGEIYNQRQLRDRLAATHQFHTQSDSEVILHLYEDLGPECVRELDGMFAFVLTDGDRVLAARDPLGIKPLYVGQDPAGGLWFASEVKALADVCPSDIREFPPGTLYTDRDGFTRWFDRGWERTPADEPEAGGGSSETTASPIPDDPIVSLLDAAVRKRLMSDVPLGVFLSGGLDSSVVAALARRHVPELHSFAVGLEGSPDLAAARKVAAHLDTRHHELVYRPADVVEALETVIYHLESDDPALIRSAIPCYFVSRLAADAVKVVLSGEGSDEAFAGYRYFEEVTDPIALHRESVRIIHGLHNVNLQRVDRMTMAHALEGRVPFLDIDFLDYVMGLPPAAKRHGAGAPDGRPEKWLLRRAFTGMLPEDILWRTKAEFAQGCGSEWTIREHAEEAVSDQDFAVARASVPTDPPEDKEACLYRRIFEGFFPGEAVRRTVGRWRGAFAAEPA